MLIFLKLEFRLILQLLQEAPLPELKIQKRRILARRRYCLQCSGEERGRGDDQGAAHVRHDKTDARIKFARMPATQSLLGMAPWYIITKIDRTAMERAIARRLARYTGRVMRPLPLTRSIVSFTFDDVPSSACTTAADMVGAAGARATYYVSGGLDRDTGGRANYHSARELGRLCEDGHEIGCHGFYHLNYQSISLEKVEADIAMNRAYFTEHGLPIPKNFAYPYGCVDRVVKRACARLFTSCRGVQNGINCGNVDLALLKAVPLFSHQLTAARIDTLLNKLTSPGCWLIFYGHGVMNDPGSYDCTPDLLAHALSATTSRGLPILTVAAALRLISAEASYAA